MKRPLLAVALFYIGGILLGQFAHAPLPVLFAISFILALTALAWNTARAFLLGPLLVLTGWTNVAWHGVALSPNDLRIVLGNGPEDILLQGTICAAPVQRIFVRNNQELWRTAAFVQARGIFRGTNWQPVLGKVIVTTPGILGSNFFAGQLVEISGVIQPPPHAFAEGLFNARDYYQHEEIYYQLKVQSPDDWRVAPGMETRRPLLSERFSAWARKTLALGLPVEDEPLRLLWTLVLDWKAPLTESVEEPFVQAGTYHIFAVDGLRIGLVAGICLGLFRAMRIPRVVCGLLALPIIWFYAGLTGWPDSAVRAAIMMSVVIIGWACNRPVDLINSLFAAAFIILLWNPLQIFQPAFQLSFCVLLCIALLLPPLQWLLFEKWFQPDPFLPMSLRRRWPSWLHHSVRYIIDIFVLSLAAWLGSIPLSAYYFHVFSLISTPANFLVVPMTALALMSSMGSLLTGAWFPGLAELFNHSSWLWMKLIIICSQWAAHPPASHFYVSTPAPITILCYYLILLTVVTGWIFRTQRKRIVFAAICAAAVLWVAQWRYETGTAEIHVLPLQGAPVIFVDSSGGNPALLLDCGNKNPTEIITRPFLRAHGVNKLENFAITVAHESHFGGARMVRDSFSVPGIFTSPVPARSLDYRALMGEPETKQRTVKSGDLLDGWSVLHPGAADHFAQADDNALVLQREIHGQSILLLSDLGHDGQSALMERHPEFRADIVIAGLPEQDEPLRDPLLFMLKPKLIVIVDSEFPPSKRASPELRARLAKCGARVIYCREAGALELRLRNHRLELSSQ